MKERKNVFAKETVTICDKCSGHMMYKGGGCYVCESCGEEYLTDFGKVKLLLIHMVRAMQLQFRERPV